MNLYLIKWYQLDAAYYATQARTYWAMMGLPGPINYAASAAYMQQESAHRAARARYLMGLEY